MGVRAPVRITEPAINVLQRSTTDQAADAGSDEPGSWDRSAPTGRSYPSVTGETSWPVRSLYGA